LSPRSAPRPALSAREFRDTFAAVRTALAASDKIILGHFQRARFSHKADGSEVTVADKGGERMLRRHLAAAWPRDPVLGEEYGGTLVDQGRCWLIDPIDGTASYVLGVPMFGTLISLLIDGEPVFGCIHLSALRETTYGARGLGCWLSRAGARARRVRVGPPRALEGAQVGLTSFKESDLARRPGPWRIQRLAREASRLRLVGDCVQYALVCRGALDAAIDPLMNPWDIGPLAVCVTEAGGAVSDLNGEQTGLIARRSLVAASSDALRAEICRLVGTPDAKPAA
jgi:histidinol-phosphatase